MNGAAFCAMTIFLTAGSLSTQQPGLQSVSSVARLFETMERSAPRGGQFFDFSEEKRALTEAVCSPAEAGDVESEIIASAKQILNHRELRDAQVAFQHLPEILGPSPYQLCVSESMQGNLQTVLYTFVRSDQYTFTLEISGQD